jgi:CAP12/Pycsar effector protein, TIR domain
MTSEAIERVTNSPGVDWSEMTRAERWSSTKPRVFIGSASEALDVARTLETLLSDFARPRLWTRTFVMGQSFIDDILAQAHECEFGLFVMTPEDLELVRDDLRRVPRDNVLLELGVFLGALGKGRALFVFAGDDAPTLPSDLSGMTAGIWESGPTTTGALAPIAQKIAAAMDTQMPMTPLGRHRDDARALARATVSRVSRALGCHPDDIGVHVWWRDEGDGTGAPVLRRVLRERSGPSPANDWAPWPSGKGVVGTAWEINETFHLDMAHPDLEAVDSEASFEKLPIDLRLGLSYQEFLVTRRDFRGVWATPIQHNETHARLGVVSLNIDHSIDAPFGTLDNSIRSALRELAHTTGVLALGG